MNVMVEFVGGPLDGKKLDSELDPEFDANKALWVLRMVAASIDIAERRENRPGTLLKWRLPSPTLTERARAEGWSEPKIRALMQTHEYGIKSYEEIEGLVLLKAHYVGIND
jgi:hypothetical protein